MASNPKSNNISPANVDFLESIGKGSFGQVYKAYYTQPNGNTVFVAVKNLHSTSTADVIEERNRMGNLNHKNIVKLIGTVFYPREGSQTFLPSIVMEYCKYGNLLEYVWNNNLTAERMVKFAHDIASGMEYMHDMDEIHGDLAARNCMVTGGMRIKIGDLGRLDEDYEGNYMNYNGESFGLPCPIRWMSPENLPDYNYGEYSKPSFSEEGDVWAFAVVLFEMWSRGKTPYEDLDNQEVINAVMEGYTPLSYEDIKVRKSIKSLMNWCWEYDAEDRPTFNGIREDIEQDNWDELNF